MSVRFFLPAIIVLHLLCNTCSADNFIVTSTANNGPGTLREAILNAAANGTSSTDFILFNLPDISRAGRTIILDSSLPELTSHIVIDGTSQNGTPFGISNAKVQIECKTLSRWFVCFEALHVSNIEVYGVYIKGNGNAGYAFEFRESNNIRFGSPGKGNIITAFPVAFHCDLRNATDSSSYNITFQSNILGIDESGDTADYTTFNNNNFDLTNVKNITIGGLGNNEGNLMCDGNYAMNINYTRPESFGYLNIQGNKVGTDRTGLKKFTTSFNGWYINGVNDGSDELQGTTDVDINITNNISAERISFFKIKNYFKIQGNKLGVGSDTVTNTGNPYSYWLLFEFCGQGIIGGPNAGDKNYIAYVAGSGVYEFHCGSITISKNSFFCNSVGIAGFDWFIYTRPKPFITIGTASASEVKGTSVPGATIELFYDDVCPGCEGKTYITSVTADINGNWVYNGPTSGGIVGTATDTYGATSEFSSAAIDADSIVIKDATCGKNNGSIKKLRVISGTEWYWEDEQGNITGHNVDLINAPAGKYKFVTSIGGNECKTESLLYEIKNIAKPSIDTSFISITQPSCGLNNGALKNEAAFNDSFQYRWMNNINTTLSNDFSLNNPLINLFVNDYYLNIRLKADSACFTQYGPFILINQSGPSLNTSTMQIGNSTCDKNNGYIKNISYQNAAGSIYIAWEDSTGKIISNNLDLTGTGKGKYLLKFKDGSTCDTIVTPYYTITDSGIIHIDSSNLRITPSGCINATGSITGLTQAGADKWRWINSSTNDTVSTNINLINVNAGSYQLILYNHFACTLVVPPYNIGEAGIIPINITSSSVHDASCNLPNGAVLLTQFSNDTSLYRFLWKDENNNTVGSYSSLMHADRGSYVLLAKDINGCEDTIFTATVKQSGNPVFDYSLLRANPDTCNAHVGNITGLLIIGGSEPYTWKWTNQGNNITDTTAFGINHLDKNTFIASVLDANLCGVISTPIIINNIDKISPTLVANDQLIPRNTSTTIKVNNPLQGIYELLEDDSPNGNVMASSPDGVFQTPVITADRSFYIRYTYGDCISSLSKVNIKVFDSTILYIPNAFSPNNDGINDRLHFIVQGKISKFSISIYNRWGGFVYSSTDVNSSWDGNVNGHALPTGSFVYIINATDYKNKNIKQSGIITLIR